MSRDFVNDLCARLPGAEVSDPWGGGHDCWKVGGKMFAVTGAINPAVSVKTDSIETAEMLVESGVARRPKYLHRSWIELSFDAPEDELEERLYDSYWLIRESLPRKVQAALGPSTNGRCIAMEDKDPDADYSSETKGLLARMKVWADSFESWFPEAAAREGDDFANMKIPAASWLVTAPIATHEVYAGCAKEILRAAANVAAAKPKAFVKTKVAAVIGHPDMFDSEVCVFFARHYWESFTQRTADDHRWTPLGPEHSLARRLKLKIPEGFVEQGYATYSRDDSDASWGDGEPPREHHNETWIYSKA